MSSSFFLYAAENCQNILSIGRISTELIRFTYHSVGEIAELGVDIPVELAELGWNRLNSNKLKDLIQNERDRSTFKIFHSLIKHGEQ